MKIDGNGPPQAAERLIASLADPTDTISIVDDLYEDYERMRLRAGRVRADLWYWMQALRIVPPLIVYWLSWEVIMFRNFMKTALRNLKRNRGHAIINIAGLAVGMACCLLITLWALDELSYDRYHDGADRIYRVYQAGSENGVGFSVPSVSFRLGEVLMDEYPEAESVVRMRLWGSSLIRYGDRSWKVSGVIAADSTLFDVFSFGLVEGDARTALARPDAIIVSRSTARRIFGDGDPVGRIVTMDGARDFMITGVFEDMPDNSHFTADVFTSIWTVDPYQLQSWFISNAFTYVRLREDADPARLEAAFADMIRSHIGPVVEKTFGVSLDEFLELRKIDFRFGLQPLTSIHLHSRMNFEMGTNGDARYVYIFTIVAAFILVIACINFVNLSTARSAERAKEVGVRKVVGSTRTLLVGQFLTESIVSSLLALLLSLGAVYGVLPFFNSLSGKTIAWTRLGDPHLVAAAAVIVLMVGVIAGVYPAFVISSFRPASVLRGRGGNGAGGGRLRAGLVVFQFTASIVLIIGTLVVGKQLRYIQSRDLGWDREQVLVLDDAYMLGGGVEAFRRELLGYPSIRSASVSGFLPVPSDRSMYDVHPEGRLDSDRAFDTQLWSIDPDYIETMGMRLVAGRNFSREMATDSEAVLINEAAARRFGWDEALGKTLTWFEQGEHQPLRTIVGVVEDFHFESMQREIGPVVMRLGGSVSAISFRITPGAAAEAVDLLEGTWERFAPGQPFSYYFLDDRFDAVYRFEQRLVRLFGAFAGLGIFIGCLGLFGLASFVAERRTKEIGIRKVLGASVREIAAMLTKQFVRWVLLANIFACPVAYLVMRRWLEGYAYRTGIGIEVFLVAAAAAFAVALVAVGYNALRAAGRNPVAALKYE